MHKVTVLKFKSYVFKILGFGSSPRVSVGGSNFVEKVPHIVLVLGLVCYAATQGTGSNIYIYIYIYIHFPKKQQERIQLVRSNREAQPHALERLLS